MAAFATHGAVVAVDFRGHGRSGGRSTVGRDEIFDLDAAVTWTRSQGYGPVTVVGFSMGAAVALRQAALGESDRRRGRRGLVTRPLVHARERADAQGALVAGDAARPDGRAGTRGPARRALVRPAGQSRRGGRRHLGCPLLLIHGAADPYFNPLQARALQRASGTADLWIELGMGHGETATTPALADRIAGWSMGAIAGSTRRPPCHTEGAQVPHHPDRAGRAARRGRLRICAPTPNPGRPPPCRAELGTTAVPDVSIEGFPFLLHAVQGEYPQVIITAANIDNGLLPGIRAQLNLSQVTLPLRDALSGNTSQLAAQSSDAAGADPAQLTVGRAESAEPDPLRRARRQSCGVDLGHGCRTADSAHRHRDHHRRERHADPVRRFARPPRAST